MCKAASYALYEGSAAHCGLLDQVGTWFLACTMPTRLWTPAGRDLGSILTLDWLGLMLGWMDLKMFWLFWARFGPGLVLEPDDAQYSACVFKNMWVVLHQIVSNWRTIILFPCWPLVLEPLYSHQFRVIPAFKEADMNTRHRHDMDIPTRHFSKK